MIFDFRNYDVWRHYDVTVAEIEVASNGFRFRILSGTTMPNINPVPKKCRIAWITDSTKTAHNDHWIGRRILIQATEIALI